MFKDFKSLKAVFNVYKIIYIILKENYMNKYRLEKIKWLVWKLKIEINVYIFLITYIKYLNIYQIYLDIILYLNLDISNNYKSHIVNYRKKMNLFPNTIYRPKELILLFGIGFLAIFTSLLISYGISKELVVEFVMNYITHGGSWNGKKAGYGFASVVCMILINGVISGLIAVPLYLNKFKFYYESLSLFIFNMTTSTLSAIVISQLWDSYNGVFWGVVFTFTILGYLLYYYVSVRKEMFLNGLGN